MLANALSSLRELFLDLAPRHLPGNRGKDWRSYVQHVLAPILRSPSLKRIHIDNGVPGLEGMDITNFVQEIGCCLPDGKWRYDGLVIVGKEGSRYWHGITVQYTTPHDFDTEEERHWAEEHVGHYVFEAMS